MSYKVDCYHGTDRTSGVNIIRSQIRIKASDKMWLGTGAYFFESLTMAEEWAIGEGLGLRRHGRKYDEYAIIRYTVTAASEELLDLTVSDSQQLFEGWRNTLIDRIKADEKNGIEEITDGYVLNDICQKLSYKVVRSYFFIPKVVDLRRIGRTFTRIPNCVIVSTRNSGVLSNPGLAQQGKVQ